jgi:hypothetical protein
VNLLSRFDNRIITIVAVSSFTVSKLFMFVIGNPYARG